MPLRQSKLDVSDADHCTSNWTLDRVPIGHHAEELIMDFKKRALINVNYSKHEKRVLEARLHRLSHLAAQGEDVGYELTAVVDALHKIEEREGRFDG